MHSQAAEAPMQILAREEQVDDLRRFLGPGARKRVLVLTGQAGIGKTTLWKSGISIALDLGFRVLVARASETETSLSFASVGDLFDGIELGLLGGLAVPQRLALAVALRRVSPADAPPEPFAILAGLLSVIRILAEVEPLLVAVDDVTSIDRPSANALAYAIRRLERAPVRFMFTRRSGRASELERAFDAADIQVVEVGPLSLGAIGHMLTQRLGRSFPRRVLRQIFETAQGNPLFAYELGRTLVERGVPEIGGDLPVPDVLEDLFRSEVANLPGAVKRVVLAVALSGELTRTELTIVADQRSLDEALAADFVVAEGIRVRSSHPLRAAASRQQSSAEEQRELHGALAAVVADEALQARHLALATTGPDPRIAATVASAAELASMRGGIQDAVDLARHALRLTPHDAAERVARILVLARFLQIAGASAQVTRLLQTNFEALPPGPARATAHLILSESSPYEAQISHLERALDESVNYPAIRARAQIRLSMLESARQIRRIAHAEKLANKVLTGLAGPDPETERLGLVAVA